MKSIQYIYILFCKRGKKKKTLEDHYCFLSQRGPTQRFLTQFSGCPLPKTSDPAQKNQFETLSRNTQHVPCNRSQNDSINMCEMFQELTTTRRFFLTLSSSIKLCAMTMTSRGSSPVLRGMMVYVMSLEELAGTNTCCLWGLLNATLHMPSVLLRITITCKQTHRSGQVHGSFAHVWHSWMLLIFPSISSNFFQLVTSNSSLEICEQKLC